MKYKILRIQSQYELEKEAQELLNDGWKLQGGVSYDSDGWFFIQAFYKEN